MVQFNAHEGMASRASAVVNSRTFRVRVVWSNPLRDRSGVGSEAGKTDQAEKADKGLNGMVWGETLPAGNSCAAFGFIAITTVAPALAATLVDFSGGERFSSFASLVQWVLEMGRRRPRIREVAMAIVSASRRNKGAEVAATGLAIALGCFWAVPIPASAAGQAPAVGSVPAAVAPNNAAAKPGNQPSAKAQADAAKSKTAKPLHAGKAHTGKAKTAPTPVVVETPPEPPAPKWPVNDAAVPASVVWNGRDLSIAASNATLGQILHDVSTATGLKVNGLDGYTDKEDGQRIYGSYGPASERDVLIQLLDGSGYNVLMIGNQGEGTPRELVLTAKAATPANVAGAGRSQAGVPQAKREEEEEPEEPEPVDAQQDLNRRPAGIPPQPGQGKSPQQMIQEIQQRQQLQQQQQQGGQPQGGQTQPPND